MYRNWEDKSGTRWVCDYHVKASAMSAPAIRMVAVNVGSYDDGFGVEFRPVLAITSTTYMEWRKRSPGQTFPDLPGTAKDARREGWEPQPQETYMGYVVMPGPDDQNFPDTLDAIRMDATVNTIERLACAPWAPEEDSARFAALVEELKKDLAKKMNPA